MGFIGPNLRVSPSATCHHLDGEASFEVRNLVPIVPIVHFGPAEKRNERIVLLLRHRAVQVVGRLVEATGLEHHGIVQGVPVEHRRDRVEEAQPLVPERRSDRGGKRIGGERTGRHHSRPGR